MDADWDELMVVNHLGPLPQAHPVPISTIVFDSSQELLWVGSQHGRVLSLAGRDLQRYTSSAAHALEPVKQILIHERGVISLSSHSIHLAQRTGLSIWHLAHSSFTELQCMSFTGKAFDELVVAGLQDHMFRIDLNHGELIETLPSEGRYIMMKRASQYICAATFTGMVHIIDSTNLNLIRSWQAHASRISDMDVKSDFLVTCGLSQRQQHGLMHDPLANVFDLKSLSPLPPIPFQPGAAFVRMHPKMSTTCIVASQTGQLQVVDIMNPHTVNLKQAHIYENNYLTALELAPTGDALALSSSLCQIHLWGSPAKIKFTEYSQNIVWPDVTTNDPIISWSEDTPLNSVGMPYYRDTLLSVWPSALCEVGALPPKVTPEMLSVMKRGEIGFFGPNLHKTHLNQVDYIRIEDENSTTIIAPKFRSEKSKEYELPSNQVKGFSDAANSIKPKTTTTRETPQIYRKLEIRYSKFGVDDFDFEFYNNTTYSGLETHIINSYANPLLQMYRFIPVLRNLALYHTAMSCIKTDCILCELGFLIDMLEKATGQNCQATNFLRTFGTLPAVASLNLQEEYSASSSLTMMIQSVNRFLLDKFSSDFRIMTPHSPYFEQAFTTTVTATIRCVHCKHEQMKAEDPQIHNLIYPTKNMLRHQGRNISRVAFSQILKTSFENQHQMRGYCPSCRRYQQLNMIRHIQRMPAVLMINADIQTIDAKQAWASPNWLPQEIGIIVDKGQFYCYQDQDLKYHVQRGVFQVQVYELVGVVAEIIDSDSKKPHLVSIINVGLSATDPTSPDSWHVFNDFCVQRISSEEALNFDPNWKLPAVLTFQLKSARNRIDDAWKQNLDASLLYTSPKPNHPTTPITPITPTKQQAQDSSLDPLSIVIPLNEKLERPKPGMYVGIDAEFVSLCPEEIAISANGTRSVVRPRRLALARVSVLRGATGSREDVPFIDDYIAISEPIVDYLTAYSGIRPGDLNSQTSTKTLVTLKTAYRKLWILLNLGCVFVGHGLLKDFRTINLQVPRAQFIDTVDLWYLRSRQRRLNLRFLAWLLLREDVQGGDAHDSIEDARTALRLWRRYELIKRGSGNNSTEGREEAENFEAQNSRIEEMVEWVYKRGRDVGYRAPNGNNIVGGGIIVNNYDNISSNTPGGGSTRPGTGRNTPEPSEGFQNTPVKRTGILERGNFGSPLK